MTHTIETRLPLAGADVQLPLMGLGTWAWGDKSTWGMNGYDRSYDLDTIREAYQTLGGRRRHVSRHRRDVRQRRERAHHRPRCSRRIARTATASSSRPSSFRFRGACRVVGS